MFVTFKRIRILWTIVIAYKNSLWYTVWQKQYNNITVFFLFQDVPYPEDNEEENPTGEASHQNNEQQNLLSSDNTQPNYGNWMRF